MRLFKKFRRSEGNSASNHHDGRMSRFLRRNFSTQGNLDEGLQLLNEYLGLTAANSHLTMSGDETVKAPTQAHARAVIYAPDMDGQADPGEVVWVNIRTQKNGELELRSVLIIGRRKHTLLGLLISSNADFNDSPNWIRIGSGPWEQEGNEAYIRLDKVLEVPESEIQRRGVSMPERRYDLIAARLRSDYGWH
ncbi:type II toxin-antitoxin system PemK/MazF family toxin [Corynebacterium anserum]|uniref:Type II toxin-antitoxin system PemK/MazF family toxin n=1 Tax=Corynebacterium anserum TaxID=2684406 RepID=A0A7G7YMM5_9CORY|nr:type II toxin-antitoxin system PemK/MazF family toxin [Corynebacterium anserum]MBC2681118.1 type II toxin-antitoxin system PemK/MazF family toxin [Corynebacterium anserum]QNH95745.1 type II toxin-antitoxin system PemK/MazF family toxin [Corynebacterium anserum]